MWSRCVAILLLGALSLAQPVVAAQDEPVVRPFDAWLAKANISLPTNISTTVQPVGIFVKLSSIVLSKIRIGSLDSQHVPPVSPGARTVLALNVKGLYLQLDGYLEIPSLRGHADLKVLIKDGSVGLDLFMSPSLPEATRILPQHNFSFDNFDPNITVNKEDLTFSNSGLAGVLQSLRGPLAKQFSELIKDQLQPMLVNITQLLTNGPIANIDMALNNAMAPRVPLPPPAPVPNAVDWRQMRGGGKGLLAKLLKAAVNVLAPGGAVDVVNGLVRLLAEAVMGQKIVPGSANFSLAIAAGLSIPLGNLTLSIDNIELSGAADSWTALNLSAVDTSPQSLHLNVGFVGPLFFALNTTLRFGPVVQPISITGGLSHLSLELTLDAALDDAKVSALTLGQLLADGGDVNLPCVANILSALSVRNSALSFVLAAPFKVGKGGGGSDLPASAGAGAGAGAGIADIVTNLLDLVSDVYFQDVPAILDGLLAKTITPALNTGLAKWLAASADARKADPSLCERSASNAVANAIAKPTYLNFSAAVQGASKALKSVGALLQHVSVQIRGEPQAAAPKRDFSAKLHAELPLLTPRGDKTSVAVNEDPTTEMDVNLMDLSGPDLEHILAAILRPLKRLQLTATNETLSLLLPPPDSEARDDPSTPFEADVNIRVHQNVGDARSLFALRFGVESVALSANASAHLNTALLALLPIGSLLRKPACLLAAAPLLRLDSFSSSADANLELGFAAVKQSMLEFHHPLAELLARYPVLANQLISPANGKRLLDALNQAMLDRPSPELSQCFANSMGPAPASLSLAFNIQQEVGDDADDADDADADDKTEGLIARLVNAEEAPTIGRAAGTAVIVSVSLIAFVGLISLAGHAYRRRHPLYKTRDMSPLYAYYSEKRWLHFLVPTLAVLTLAVHIYGLVLCVARVRARIFLTSQDTLLSGVNNDGGPKVGDVVLADIYLLNFTFRTMVLYFYKAQAYFLVFLIAFGTCALPLLMIFTLLLVWTTPSLWLTRYRGRVFSVLGVVGKFAFVDCFFIAYITSTLNNVITIDEEIGTRLALSCEPDIGLYVIVTAHAATLLLNHWMLTLHYSRPRREGPTNKLNGNSNHSPLLSESREASQSEVSQSVGGPVALASKSAACFPQPPPPQSARLAVLMLVMVSVTSLIAAKIDGKMLCFDFDGVLGSVVHDSSCYGLLSLLKVLPDGITRPDSAVAEVVIVVFYVLLSVVFPILTFLCWAVLWSCCASKRRMNHEAGLLADTSHTRQILYNITQFCFAWSGMDVLALSSYAASFNMNEVGRWVIRDRLGGVCDALENISGNDCIVVDGSVGSGWIWLAVASVAFLATHLLTLSYRPAFMTQQMMLHDLTKKGSF